ncbi:MAG: 2-octaprenyl-6-methoxyphenyl hydroxylase [Rhodospirillaceae bacterium]|nr:2-octaprenyl-6-methoxyphenyl hydroxylase [Rhodospirillaceae bacterium]
MRAIPKNCNFDSGDILIVGGGLTGLVLANALGVAGVRVTVIDPIPKAQFLSSKFDGRTTAISAGSRLALEVIGAWKNMENQASEILEIRVSDGDSPLFLHFGHTDINAGPLGFILENRIIRSSLIKCLEKLPTVKLRFEDRVKSIERHIGFISATTDNSAVHQVRLVVAADGRNSPLRQMEEIPVKQWRYPQIGIVCTVRHEKTHNGVAQEHFLPPGPFAILPMTERRSSIVWTESEKLAPAILSLSTDDFTQELKMRFGNYLGELKLAGPIFSYPLGLLHADKYTKPRFALLGDAAHAIHPIAGQGLNLGIRDAAVLAEIIIDAMRLGLDPGSDKVLDDYERWRRFDNTLMVAATDGLNRLFSNAIPPFKLARDVGLAMVNRSPPIKKLFMLHAMGLLGDLPKLIRGEKI